ncbi:MAG TPA: glycosyltransferase family A protein [Rhizomicrobium sp.]
MNAVTVFCAVWNRDPRRHELLRNHRENLRRQTLAVDPVYVFDGGDPPPAWLDAQTITAGSELTIYQAWNLALAAVRTPLVMNLNLDDRLAPDAVEKLAAHLAASGALLAGGDWRICYSQAETDAVSPCRPAAEIPFSPDCPPAAETPRRLGSGTGERLTFGPGTMWRMEAHLRAPRYPWRLNDGTLIRSVADGAFWSVLARLGAPLTRLPLVIGNYHFHPREQAEYRVREDLIEMMPRLMKI